LQSWNLTQMFKMELHNAIASLQGYIEGCFQQPSMQHQHLSGAGAIHFFEEKMQVYFNKKHAVTFSNATTALQTLCIAMYLNNTEIVTSPINWGGSISPFLLHRNKLRFTSFDPVSLNLSVRDLPSAITQKTKAVLSVDYNGTPVDSEAVKNFCLQNNLLYISDCAQSFGSFFNHKPAGYFADVIVLSFSPGKSFFAGEGGAVITDDDTIYEKLLWYSQHPSRQKIVFGVSNFNDYAPINGRMNPLSAILLNETFETSIAKLKKYQEKCFCVLSQLQIEKLIEPTPHINTSTSSSFFNFSLQIKPLVTFQQLNDFLYERNQLFTAIPSYPKLIPFDMSFRKQFRGKYSCSQHLFKQGKSVQFNDRIKLIISQ
jgi:perosamine synthetase